MDEGQSGWLEGEDVMIALRGVNNKLTEAEEEYLYRVCTVFSVKNFVESSFFIWKDILSFSLFLPCLFRKKKISYCDR